MRVGHGRCIPAVREDWPMTVAEGEAIANIKSGDAWYDRSQEDHVVIHHAMSIESRLYVWASQSHATGRKLGKALRDHSWSGLARRGRLTDTSWMWTPQPGECDDETCPHRATSRRHYAHAGYSSRGRQ